MKKLKIGSIVALALFFLGCQKKEIIQTASGGAIASVEQTEVKASSHKMGSSAVPVCKDDHFTGGGAILLSGSDHGNLSVWGRMELANCKKWGHLTYTDNLANIKVKAEDVTFYWFPSTTDRIMEGNCEINGNPGFTYTVEVSDNGEPGTNDKFSISLSNGYNAGGTLSSGNIQIHK